ncbi:MAG: hypothetical protein ABNH38_18795 [Tateyamaria sp.]|uniref:hypothetical protein n=1 Tax=Tateyamaria sp. TaxID=1929288 RepID=UPI0032DCAECB
MGNPAHPHTIAGKAGFQRIEGIGTVSALRMGWMAPASPGVVMRHSAAAMNRF